MYNTNNIRIVIHDFLDGNLTESQSEVLWAELLGRPEELEYLETLATLKKMGYAGKFENLNYQAPVLHLNQKTEQVHTGKFSNIKQYLVAASILLAGMLVLYDVFPGSDLITGISPIATIEYDIERSAEITTLFEAHLQKAVSYSAGGDIAKALNELDEASALQFTPDQEIDLNMVKGAILYNSAEYEEASIIFTDLSTVPDIDKLNLEKSLWYLANAQIHLEQKAEAKVNIEKVIELDGTFSRVAKNTLSRF